MCDDLNEIELMFTCMKEGDWFVFSEQWVNDLFEDPIETAWEYGVDAVYAGDSYVFKRGEVVIQ